jgi:CRP/FNR family cyclic AMP-dependent transcriptional regulator
MSQRVFGYRIEKDIVTELAQIIRTYVLSMEGVSQFSPNRRSASLYLEGSAADNVYFLESGLVKTYKLGGDAKEITLEIIMPGELFGLEAFGVDGEREVAAEILQEGSVRVIPRDVFLKFCNSRPDIWRVLVETLLVNKQRLEKKIGMLSLMDVEHRILHFVTQLADTIGTRTDGPERSIPISQGELASLIGATRETTSMVLNVLARRGLLRLSRRQLTVTSLELLRATAVR